MQANASPQPHAPRCNGTRRDKGPCGNPPVRGANVCRMHGGAAPQVKAKAQERVAEGEAQRTLAALAEVLGPVEPVLNPLLELSRIAGEALRWKQVIAGRVAELEELRYKGMGGEQVRAEIALFERALDRCSLVLSNIVRLNIDERLATITERQGHTIAAVISTVLEKLDLGDKAGQVRELVAVELERLGA
jgi:hypothetical protein